MEKYEVVIIGAGPAGLRVALVLAEAGKEVLVLEKNMITGPTICAGGLTIKDMDIIPKNIVDKNFRLLRSWQKESNLGELVFVVVRALFSRYMKSSKLRIQYISSESKR